MSARLRTPFAEDAGRAADHDGAVVERGIFDHRAGEEAFRKRGRINEGQHGGSGRAARLESAVVFVMLEIAAPYQREDAAGPVIERDDRALQIFRRGRRLALFVRRFASALLQELHILGVGLMIVTGGFLGGVELGAE